MNKLISPGHVFVVPSFLVALDLHNAEYDDDFNIHAAESDSVAGRRRQLQRPSEEVVRIISDTTSLLLSWGMPAVSDYDGPEPLQMLQSINNDIQDTFRRSDGKRTVFPKGFEPTPVQLPKTMDASKHIPVGAALKLTALLNEYDRQVVKDVFQLRTYITNRLLEISNCGSTKDELRALELLGKISDVGLFVEKSEITVTATTPAQIEHAIKEKINRLLGRQNVQIEEAEYDETDIEEKNYEEEDGYDEEEDEDSDNVESE